MLRGQGIFRKKKANCSSMIGGEVTEFFVAVGYSTDRIWLLGRSWMKTLGQKGIMEYERDNGQWWIVQLLTGI